MMEIVLWVLVAFTVFLTFWNCSTGKEIDELKDSQEINESMFEDLEERIEDLEYDVENLEDDFYELLEALGMEVREYPEERCIEFKEDLHEEFIKEENKKKGKK
ncbi:MAG: hypothetical protein WC554_15790 [Clostridia bacterium]